MYAVLGNHDYGARYPSSPKSPGFARAVRGALEGTGISVLSNDAVALASPAGRGERLYLVGIGRRSGPAA